MPRHWLFFIALISILVFRVLVIDTKYFAEWFWYQGDAVSYFALLKFQENPLVLEYIGGWPLPVFVITMFMYWMAGDNAGDINTQFLLLPLAYLPFSIIGSMLQAQSFEPIKILTHPLVIIPSGYLYLLPWIIFVWLFTKLKLVVDDEH